MQEVWFISELTQQLGHLFIKFTCEMILACSRLCSTYTYLPWISDTSSQGYTNLQSLVKCLDHRDALTSNYLPDPAPNNTHLLACCRLACQFAARSLLTSCPRLSLPGGKMPEKAEKQLTCPFSHQLCTWRDIVVRS